MWLVAPFSIFHNKVKGRTVRVNVNKSNQEIILIKLDQMIELIKSNKAIIIINLDQ